MQTGTATTRTSGDSTVPRTLRHLFLTLAGGDARGPGGRAVRKSCASLLLAEVELGPPGCIAAMEGRVPPRPASEAANVKEIEAEIGLR